MTVGASIEPLAARKCRGTCRTGTVQPGQVLCPTCWWQLDPTAQHLLTIRDEHYLGRVADLHRELAAGTPLRHIVVRGVNGPGPAGEALC